MSQTPPRSCPLLSRPPRPRGLSGWPKDARGELEARLQAMGASLTELSDAREWAGRPRLSDSTAQERHYAPLWLLGTEGAEALATIRVLRALLLEQLAEQTLKPHLRQARTLLGLRSGPKRWRLRELQVCYAQARLLQLWAEQEAAGGE